MTKTNDPTKEQQWRVKYRDGMTEETSIVRGRNATVEVPHNSDTPVMVVFDGFETVKFVFTDVVSVDELDG